MPSLEENSKNTTKVLKSESKEETGAPVKTSREDLSGSEDAKKRVKTEVDDIKRMIDEVKIE